MRVPIIDSAGITVEVDLLAGASCDGSLSPSLLPNAKDSPVRKSFFSCGRGFFIFLGI